MAVGYKVKPEKFVDKEFKSRAFIEDAADWRGVVQMSRELQGVATWHVATCYVSHGTACVDKGTAMHDDAGGGGVTHPHGAPRGPRA